MKILPIVRCNLNSSTNAQSFSQILDNSLEVNLQVNKLPKNISQAQDHVIQTYQDSVEISPEALQAYNNLKMNNETSTDTVTSKTNNTQATFKKAKQIYLKQR